MSTAEYGTVDLVITYSTLLLPFVTLALEQALFRFLIDVRDDKDKESSYISTTVFTSLLFTCIVFTILFLIYCITNNELFLYFGLVLVGSVMSAVSLQISRGLGDNVGYEKLFHKYVDMPLWKQVASKLKRLAKKLSGGGKLMNMLTHTKTMV